MKIVKGISLFLICPVILLGIGFYLGFATNEFFYPGDQSLKNVQFVEESGEKGEENIYQLTTSSSQDLGVIDEAAKAYGEAKAVAAATETLCVDTEYVLVEVDVVEGSKEETELRLPDKYVGMNREQFLEAMENYEFAPPLSELERGFTSLEVLSFSREKVVVQMNYKFVQPSTSFYLAVYDNRVVVFLEDKSTIYIETDILLDSLSDDLQQEIINMLHVESEEELYHLLESYSS